MLKVAFALLSASLSLRAAASEPPLHVPASSSEPSSSAGQIQRMDGPRPRLREAPIAIRFDGAVGFVAYESRVAHYVGGFTGDVVGRVRWSDLEAGALAAGSVLLFNGSNRYYGLLAGFRHRLPPEGTRGPPRCW